MAAFDGGRLGIGQFYDPETTRNPFRGVFEEGTRKTAEDYERYQMESDPRYNPDTGIIEQDWNRPVLDVQDATSAQFGDYRMTPQSPSVRESGHTFDFYQNPYRTEGSVEEEMGRTAIDPLEDPGRALATTTMARAFQGSGFKPVQLPQPERQSVQANKALEAEGKQVMFDQNKIPKWNESKSFGAGLLSFGLNLLSGNDLATSFKVGADHFNQSFGREKREIWAQDLVEQGFDAQDIQAWIETGDKNALKDPMEKKMQMQRFQMGQQQLDNLMYENSPEMRNYKLQREYQNDAMKIAGFNSDQAYKAASLRLQEMGLALKERAATLKAQGANDLTARDYSQLANTVMPTIKVANQRINFSDAALRDMQDIRRYKAEGNTAGVQGSMASFQYNYARAMKGGTGMITEKDKESSTKLDSKIDNMFNVISRATTGMPTDTALDMLETSVVNDIQNQTDGVRMIAEQVYNTYAPEFGHEVAQKAVRRIMAGGSMGNLGFDPYSGSLVTDDRLQRIGPSTVKIQR